jgi:hypothetical protein
MQNKLNIGNFSRLSYDECAYPDKLKESVSPAQYRLSPDQMYNCNSCLSDFGPRSSNNGRGNDVSRNGETGYAASQDLVDVDSILSNRNVKQSKCKTGHVNPIDVTKYKLNNVKLCSNYLNPEASRLSYPASNYRDMPIDRFYNLYRNPQANIFWDGAVNTRLEAKDNMVVDIPVPWVDRTAPNEVKGVKQCGINVSCT